jgi:DnaJ-class molecular chaperone
MAGEAAALLGIIDPYTEADVSAAYRAKAKTTHPDAGGSSEAFAAVDRAKHVLMRWLERSDRSEAAADTGVKCQRCNGTGYTVSQRAWRGMRVQCIRCRGTGEEGVEHEKGDHR